MWFGTYDGLNKYDGYNFKVYRNKIGDSTSLTGNTIYCIAQDNNHDIWVGGVKGASKLNKNTEEFSRLSYYDVALGKAFPITGEVHQIQKIANGNILLGSQRFGLLLFKPGELIGSQIPINVNGEKHYNYNALAIEYNNQINTCWVSIKNRGIYTIDCKTLTLSEKYMKFKQTICMFFDEITDTLWIGTEEGLFNINLKNENVSGNFLSKRVHVTKIIKDKEQKFWVTTDGLGVFTSTILNNKFAIIPYSLDNHQPLSSSNSFFSVYEDHQGNIWFGTLRAGLSLLGKKPLHFKHILVPKESDGSSSDNFILSFSEAKNEGLWIGTDGAGLKYWNRSKNTFTNVFDETNDASLKNSFVTGITKGEGDDLWISTWYTGIIYLNTKTKNVKRYECFNLHTNQIEKNVWFIFKDHSNRLWASTTNEGTLYLYNKIEDKFEVFHKDITNLQSIEQTSDGKLWAGNYNTLFKIDIDAVTYQSYDLGYPIRSIKEDHEQNLWIGTQEGGLLLFDQNTGSYERFTKADGLPGNNILRILEDNNHNLWLSTYNGLTKFNKKDIFRNFSVSDGLQSNQFSFNAALKLSDGAMVFGGINGFNIFNPNDIVEQQSKKELRLNEIWLNNKPLHNVSEYITTSDYNGLKKLKLPYYQTALSLEFVSIEFWHPDKLQYAYKLEGWDENWNVIDNIRRANYSKLLDGDYVFKVKIKDDNGTWGKPVTLATIKVLPPWYRTWWAYLLYIIFTIGVVYIGITYSKNKVQMKHNVELAKLESKKEKELATQQREMFTYISHEFRTPLSLIIDPIKQIVDKDIGTDKTDNEEGLKVAYRNAKRLLSLVNQFLVFRKAESNAIDLKIAFFDLKLLCAEVYECFVNLAEEQQIDFKLILPETETKVYADYERIEIALFNLLSNAFKHTPKNGNINLEIQTNNDVVKIFISDTGCGISAEDLPYIFDKFKRVKTNSHTKSGFGIGLFVVDHFIKKHKGSINCKSIVGEGTTFTITLKLDKDHFGDINILENIPTHTELAQELLISDTTDTKVAKEINEKLNFKKEFISEKRSVLIVEDDTEMREYLISLFKTDYIVYNAINGIDGYDQILKYNPDIVISDIAMEGLNGVELCSKLKENENLNHIPIILLTATSSPEIQLQSISNGADDYITKPFDSSILKAKVERLLISRNELRKYFLENITQKEDYKVPAEFKDFLIKCNQIIEANLSNKDFNLKMLAQDMGMSHRSLYDKIKQITGLTLNAYIRNVRIRHAAFLMLTENKTIAQIGSLVGLEDQKYFRQQFVKIYEMTPSEYIKRYKDAFHKNLNIISKKNN
ncbi:hybrid sensor histidine kinase/response regulator [Neptunitalea sp. Y10]|uniref:histidine kinase n=2 Tax=Neptunitalea lumnitzerae TaxID=2965509 RepID=A0ABQ5MJD1_9FLAO|nr:hybrid sensor histidine kinase/response regulator [Neptunitalea sp. Y10]